MTRSLMLGLLLWFSTVLLPISASAQARVGLVIGNQQYRHVSGLDNPASDARAIANTLKRLGFSVMQGIDLDMSDTVSLLSQFARIADGAEIAVVFFAGHGLQVDGRNYLLPVDARLTDDRDLRRHAVDLNELLDAARGARGLRLVILDACRDNPVADRLKRAMGTRSAAVGRGLARVEGLEPDTLVAFATQADAVALDGSGRNNSPYTEALLKHLETPGLDVRLMLGRVRDTVMQSTGNTQKPYTYGSLGGQEIVFRQNVARPAEPPSRPAPEAFAVPSQQIPPQPPSLPAAATGWQAGLSAFDRQRLASYQSSLSTAMKSITAPENDPERRYVEWLQTSPLLAINETELGGVYKCRVTLLDDGIITYDWMGCRIRNQNGVLAFEKYGGSQKNYGVLHRISPQQYGYIGAWSIDGLMKYNKNEPKADPDCNNYPNKVGIMHKISTNHYVIGLPQDLCGEFEYLEVRK